MFGVSLREGWEREEAPGVCYNGLLALQHRGQESAGIAVNDDGVFTSYRDVGLVSEVFPQERLRALGRTPCTATKTWAW